MSKRASVYQKNKLLYIFGMSKTVDGVWIADGDIFKVSESDVEQIAAAVKKSLQNSTEGVSHPAQSEWRDIDNRFMENLGYKSFSSFMKNAKCLNITEDDGGIYLEPTENGGSKKGFIPVSGIPLSVDMQTSALGESVLQGLEKSSR